VSPDLFTLLLAAPERAMELPAADAVALLARTEGLVAVLRTRLAGMPAALPNGHDGPARPEERLLSAPEVAALFRRSVAWVYRRSRTAEWRAFAVREGRKTLRFREAGLLRHVAKK
jgi:hypothetical protein